VSTPAPPRSAFAVPAFRRLLVGETVSNVGDSALFLTLGIWAKDLTGSSSAAGLVFFFLALPVLASPLFGQLADRVRRRPLLLATNALAGVGVLALLLVDSPDDLWLLYVVAAGYGVVGYVTAPARSGLLRDLLEDHQLDTANGTLMTLDQGLRIVSPLLGAGLYAAFGGPALAALASATFGLAVLALLTVHVQESEPEGRTEREPWRQEVSAGFRHVARTPALRRITACVAASMLVIGLADTALFSVVDEGLGRDPAFFGVLMSAQGAGSIAGGVVSVWLLRRIGGQRLVGVALVAFALSGLTMFASQEWVVLAGRVLGGAAIPWAFVPAATVRQRLTPPRLQGRTSSAVNLAVTLPQTASIAAGAALLTVVDFRWSVLALVVVTAAAALPLLLRRPAPERLDEPPAPTTPATPSGMPSDPAPLSPS
jgi:MFS family permease